MTKLLFSIKEAKRLGLKINESFCCFCQRELPNKTFITENGCLWCDSTSKEDVKPKYCMNKTDRKKCIKIMTDSLYGVIKKEKRGNEKT
jgi:hypothetical protein